MSKTDKIKIEIKDLGEGELELEGELGAERFSTYWSKAIKSLGEEVKIDGFRPGHIPEKVLVDNLGEAKVLYEMAEMAIAEAYPEILQDNEIEAIGRPSITITKIAKDNPLGFKIVTATTPKIKLADYKKIAGEINSQKNEDINIEEAEVDKVIEDVRRSRAGHDHSHHDHKDGEKCDSTSPEPGAEAGHDNQDSDKILSASGKDSGETLPELNDDFAKSLGNFETLADLKNKIKENLKLEHEAKAKEKKRLALVDAIKDKSELLIPKILIEAEKDKMLAEMESQISQMGLKFDDYLAHLKKTREELKSAWDVDAKNRVAFSLIVNEVAKAEKITVPEDELKQEVDFLAEQYKDIDRRRLESYAEGLIVNEKVLEFLETVK